MIFSRAATIRDSLTRTRRSVFGQIAGLFGPGEITEEFWDELEELLIMADIGVDTTTALITNLREDIIGHSWRRAEQVAGLLKERLVDILEAPQRPYLEGNRQLSVVLVVGVNGSGKTTSIAKLAKYHKDRGQKVMLVAGDTFRAAAIDQLKIWGERVGVEVIASQPGGDPGAVVYDAIRASRSRNVDVLIIDTAGRLHTKFNLMEELKKVYNVAQKQVHRAPHETLLVLDATTGQNALSQAKVFKQAAQISGVILAKLDGTAKGGMAFAIARDLELPIFFVGTGEKVEDLAEFNARAFVDGLFSEEK
ncbi:MAG: signal recognition particle-docking protein FtsY [Chloroflexi bacterium]|nr:signal recognition particle-docking protein FtsY [Chloroflexota bacterium]